MVNATDPLHDVARFNNVVFVNTLIAISNIKGIIGGATLPDTSTCDRNDNGTPDQADSASCALYIAAGIGNCIDLGATFSAPFLNVKFTGLVATYTGYIITIDDNGGPASAPDCQATGKNLLTGGLVAATTSETCTDTGGLDWPCPFENDGVPVDVVSIFDENLKSSDEFLSSIFGSDTGEVGEAVTDLRTDACSADGNCTSKDMADYLQTLD
jgi:hypothetical protein